MRHEVHLTAKGLRAAPIAVAPLLIFAALAGGFNGAASVALGAGIVVGNSVLAAASTGWSRTLGPGTVIVGYAMYAVRMFAVFAALTVVAVLPWVDRPLLAIAFCSTLAVTLTAACLSFVRNSYVPGWRLAR